MKQLRMALIWLGWPIFYLALNNTKRTRVIIAHKEQILLVQPRLSDRVWDLPGGGVHKRERDKTAACRELKEELGISSSTAQLYPIGSLDYTNRKITNKLIVYKLSLTKKPTLSLQKLEIRKAQWHSTKEIKDLPLSQGATAVLRFAGLL